MPPGHVRYLPARRSVSASWHERLEAGINDRTVIAVAQT